jgi:glycosyltransferase involved in cell wall biosynthesis
MLDAYDKPLRLVMLPWMVAGVRTQYENLRLVELPPGIVVDTLPIVPYQEGGAIERLPVLRSSQKGTLRSTMHTLPLFHKEDFDAVWTQALLPLLPFVAACDARLKQLPALVYTIDTTPALMDPWTPIYYGRPTASPAKRGMRDLLYRYLLRHCAAVTPWSNWAARSFIRDYGVPEERVHVIPPGVDLQQWSVPARRLCGDDDAGQRPFRLLFVGADFERKGGPLLRDVFRRHLRETCELHLVTKAEGVAEEPGVRVYRGFGPNEPGLRDLYAACDALVLPTRADCFSLASIEAMACSLPVISCPVGGIPEIVRHEETGLLVPPDDGTALLDAIRRLRDNLLQKSSMGRSGRRIVEEYFDNKRNSAELFELITEMYQISVH